jgi:hypothetical protein
MVAEPGTDVRAWPLTGALPAVQNRTAILLALRAMARPAHDRVQACVSAD